jgi:hypothetical protein
MIPFHSSEKSGIRATLSLYPLGQTFTPQAARSPLSLPPARCRSGKPASQKKRSKPRRFGRIHTFLIQVFSSGRGDPPKRVTVARSARPIPREPVKTSGKGLPRPKLFAQNPAKGAAPGHNESIRKRQTRNVPRQRRGFIRMKLKGWAKIPITGT